MPSANSHPRLEFAGGMPRVKALKALKALMTLIIRRSDHPAQLRLATE
jgi:hypothetical protein